MIYISNYNFSIIKKSSDNFIIVNNTLDTHAHLGSYKGCKILLGLIKRNESIKNPYLRTAKERLIPKQNRRKKKDKYYNRSREQRRAMGDKRA